MPVYVGVDWAHDHHDVYVTNERSEKLGAFRIAHSVEGMDLLTKRVRALGVAAAAVQIAIERPDGLLVAALLDQGYSVYPINPKAVDRYRDRHHTSGAKDDARDAQALAHILRTDGERFRPLAPESELAAELRLTIRAYRELVAEGVRFKPEAGPRREEVGALHGGRRAPASTNTIGAGTCQWGACRTVTSGGPTGELRSLVGCPPPPKRRLGRRV